MDGAHPSQREFRYSDAAPTWSNGYIWPVLLDELERLPRERFSGAQLFELGCGNGATAAMLAARGYQVTAVDTSESGVARARDAYPTCRFGIANAYDDLAAVYGRFPLVVSLEVIEHLFDPRLFARRLYELAEPDGVVMVSTPYHGYAKNLALALSGSFDAHFTALWDGGHIKFFSIRTLLSLLEEAGFIDIRFRRVGRIPIIAKSMVAIARRGADQETTASRKVSLAP